MAHILSYGSLNLDLVYQVPHFVQAGETLSSTSRTVHCGGKGLNQSIAVSRSGQKVHHAGLLGPEGARLAELLSGSGVDLRYLKHTDVPQGHAVIQVQPDGQNCIFLYGGSNQAVTPQEIDEVLMQLNAGDYLLLQNEIANLTYLLRAAARRGLRVVLNASPISDELLNADLSGVDWLVVNEIECAAMAGCGDARPAMRRLKQRYPSLGILLTLGSEGSVSWKDGTEVRQCAYPGQGRRHDRRGRYVHGLFRRLPRAGHGTADGHAVCVHGLRHLRHPPRRSSVHPPDG